MEDRWWEKKKEVATIWQACSTPEGLNYYYNTETNETTWNKPEELMTEDEKSDAGDWYWVPDKVHCFVPAKMIQASKSGNKIKVVLDNGEERKVNTAEAEPLNKASLQRVVEDLVLLDRMSQPLILHNIGQRFASQKIYTNVGTIVIAVNPYCRLPIYTEEVKDTYIHRGVKNDLPPHVFNVGYMAFKNMKDFSENQSIIISGESGAGKTETTKQCLNFISTCAGSVGGIEKKVLQANPILEAFGNAKTIRNDNSSRFGKYMQIFFNDQNQMCSSDTKNYLLEKIRVVSQGPNERNYHIFYQLARSRNDSALQSLDLLEVEQFTYLTSGNCTTVPSIDDVQEFKEVQQAFKDLNFNAEEVSHIYELCSAVLHLGNVKFSGNEKKTTVDTNTLAAVAKLLIVDTDALGSSLTSRLLKIRGQDPTPVNLAPNVASDNRDALAKFIYGNLFDWLVARVNTSMGDSSSFKKYIGILDIFGFEIFERNSFEQLCINFTNEMLQQHFNTHTFKLEESVYRAEQIKFKHVDFIDNQPMVDLIKKKPVGIIPILDEELRVPRGSDDGFVSKLHDQHVKNRVYKRFLKNPKCFVVMHYAGDVVYDSEGFLEKNRDTLTSDLMDLVQGSKHPLLVKLFSSDSKSSGGKKSSLGKQFTEQLDNLMVTLNQTHPHYIRCVKPNQNKSSTEFNGRMCLEQLTYSGVFEAVAIRKQGYPFRLPHAKFAEHYAPISDGTGSNTSEKCKNIIEEAKLDKKNVQMGKTQVLYRADEYKKLELLRGIKTAKVEINKNLTRLTGIDTSSMSKEQKEDFMKDLARGVRQADDFRIESPVAEKARNLLEKSIEDRIDPQTKQDLKDAEESMDLGKLEAVVFKCNKNGFRTQATRKCEDLLEKVKDAEAALGAAISEMDEEYFGKALEMCEAFNYNGENVALARELLSGLIEAKEKLSQAIQSKDHLELQSVLELCDSINYSSGTVNAAKSMLVRVMDVRALLEQAKQTVSKETLDYALAQAVDLDYESTLTLESKHLSSRVDFICAEIDQAGATLEENSIRACVQAGHEIKLQDAWMEYFDQLIEGPYDEFLAAQFDKAMELNDIDRAVRISMKQKDVFCQREGASFSFDRYNQLRDALEWSSARFAGLGKDGRVKHFLTWQKSRIHTTITKPIGAIADKDKKKHMKKIALQHYTVLQMRMGDVSPKNTEALYAEVLKEAMQSPELRTEVYAHVMKVLRQGVDDHTDKPDYTGKEKAWEMFSVLCTLFQPPVDMENYLESYIRDPANTQFAKKHRTDGLLRRIMINGDAKVAPTAMQLMDIPTYLTSQNLQVFDEPFVQNPSYQGLLSPFVPYSSGGNQYNVPVLPARRSSLPRNELNPVAPSAPPPVPKKNPWQEVVDESSGDIYYWNEETNETTWDKPF